MRKIDLIVIHCSATCVGAGPLDRACSQDLSVTADVEMIAGAVKSTSAVRGFQGLTGKGTVLARGAAMYHSIGIAYEGGLDHYGNPKDTRTEWQRHSLRVLVRALLMDYPEAKVAGHRDLSPDLNNNGEVEPMEWTKQCPCFEVKKEKW